MSKMFYPVFAGAASKGKPRSPNLHVSRKWSRASKPSLRQIHTKMSGNYFHRGISRLRAEELLLSAGEDGSFLVRDSETLQGAYVLCLLFQSRVHQYRVLPGHDNKLSIQAEGGAPEPKYPDLNSLVADYIKRGDKNGLAFGLKFPVPPDKGEEVDSDDDDYQDNPPGVPPPPLVRENANINGLDANPEEQKIKVTLLNNFSKLDKTSVEPDFLEALRDYFERGIETDVTAVKAGDTNLPEFQKLLEFSAKNLQRELDRFLRKVRTISDLLTVPETSALTRSPSMMDKGGSSVPAMLEKMNKCRSNLMALDNKVQETLRYFSVSLYDCLPFESLDSDPLPESFTPLLSSLGKPHIPRSDFEVKLIRTGKQSKMTLSVDIPHGKLYAVKPSKDSFDPNNVFTHERITQLVKSTKDNTKLDMLILDEEKKKKQTKFTVVFTSVHVRETFCQQIMQMKNMHSSIVDVDQISVFVGTWNMGDSQPTASINSWLRCNGTGKPRDPQVLGVIPHDMYVIGTQESAMTEKDWVNFVKNHIKSCLMADVELVEVCTLWGIRLVVLVKKQLRQYINRIQHSTVRTGIANTLGNKGAVGISFYFKGTSFCFINCHLTSGDERNERRNQNYRDIIKGLSLGQKHLGLFDVLNQFNHLFWLGDLNYRIEDNIATILEKVESRDIEYLITKDQLKKVQREKKGFCGFCEEDISFMPTYRLPRFQIEYKYDWKKVKKTGERINAPSWCDRVLWRSYPGTYIENLAYGCADKVLGSDHRPVFSSFNVGVTSDFVMNRNSLTTESLIKIVFHQIVAQVKTCCKQYFYLEFHSTCLADVASSSANTSFQQHKTGFYTCPVWEKKQIPELRPLFGDEEYLGDQHILIAVRSRDSDNESYGECVVEMKNKIDINKPQAFECQLLHQGEVTGKLSGQVHALTGSFTPRSSIKKSYELVALDTEYIDPELMHSDSPPSADTLTPLTGPQISNSHATLTHVQSMPAALLDKPPIPISQRPAVDDLPSVYKYGDVQSSALFQKQLEHNLCDSSRIRIQLPTGQGAMQASHKSAPVGCTVTEPPNKPPPPVPKKQPSYVNIPKQKNPIGEWLKGINLPQYQDNFIKNGFDQLQFIKNMSKTDLMEIGIRNMIHIDLILESLKRMSL
ncbi:phosphatidylinositol 3,4,5-trisphosphate 5-phosphatase 2-like isoform X5 [Saccostrea echinata]|uniref:phosphatidylinositol 3,4,5-trisphosphate 5-phosphatase 2-like isoform X5 n=1 Tax=Saccostrea echinata TaxID=191078 RepID=UPI002A8373C3|nr:phosphatidylinositol 3,4,5-trisphosphate 5-phosphatase 2-like isoform X5 [Saccostrea echinata]